VLSPEEEKFLHAFGGNLCKFLNVVWEERYKYVLYPLLARFDDSYDTLFGVLGSKTIRTPYWRKKVIHSVEQFVKSMTSENERSLVNQVRLELNAKREKELKALDEKIESGAELTRYEHLLKLAETWHAYSFATGTFPDLDKFGPVLDDGITWEDLVKVLSYRRKTEHEWNWVEKHLRTPEALVENLTTLMTTIPD